MENKLKFSTEAQQIYTNISSVLSVFSFRFNLFRFAHYKYYNTPMWSNIFFLFFQIETAGEFQRKIKIIIPMKKRNKIVAIVEERNEEYERWDDQKNHIDLVLNGISFIVFRKSNKISSNKICKIDNFSNK